jgi:transposase InsO family protein
MAERARENGAINLNYLHHITDAQYQEALQWLLEGVRPARGSQAALARFARRWREAEVREVEGERRVFLAGREVVPESRVQTVLARLYDDPCTGGNAGADRFYEKVSAAYVGISREDVRRFVSRDETHQVHRRLVNRMRVVRPLPVPEGPRGRWQMDLVDMGEELQHDNLGYRYVLTIVDTFSKYAWACRLKTKEAEEVVAALEDVLGSEEGEGPHLLQSDNGGEFRNRLMAALAEARGFKQIFGSAYRPQSQGAVERFNQTLKRMLHAHMTRFGTRVWADVLQLLLDNYNNSLHASTRFAPAYLHRARDAEAERVARERMQARNAGWIRKYGKRFAPLQVGDHVRVGLLVFADFRREAAIWVRGYRPQWTREVWRVTSISRPRPAAAGLPMYTVEEVGTGRSLHTSRDMLQRLPSPEARRTPEAARPRVPGFFYREAQRGQARHAPRPEPAVPPSPMQITEEARRRRRPSVLLREMYML